MTHNDELFERAKRVIPGGVNSPVRSFKGVGGTPKFIVRAEGASLWDSEGKQYIDYVGSWGPMILGHGAPPVVEAITRQAARGVSFGAPTELEIEMAEMIQDFMPSIEMVRMVNSGTEACMSAVRLARAATGRDLIVKFEGCYHGHADFFLSKAGSGLATLGEPTSPGVPRGVAAGTLNARYNDVASVEDLFSQNKGKIAAVIVEPVVGNMGCVVPREGFLRRLRDLCTREAAILIFDEVMTGFRVAAGGAQDRFGVTPDLTTLGKVIGGGLPVGAYGGRRDLMSMIAPSGAVYQAGTLSGNPLAMAAGLAQLTWLRDHPDVYRTLEERGAALQGAVINHAKARNYPVQFARCGSMATLFFSSVEIESWDDALHCDTKAYARYFWNLMDAGIYMPPSQYEAFFLSAAHTVEIVETTGKAICAALDAAFAGG